MSFITKPWNGLAGYKTYIVGGFTIIGALVSWATGDISLLDTAKLVVPALLGMSVRSGVSTAVASKGKK